MTTFNRKAALVLCCAAVLWVFAGVSGSASPFNRTTILKFSGAVALPGVRLEAGEYIFELLDPSATLNVVRVRSKERSKLHLVTITRPVSRPAGTGTRPMVTLGEARPGAPVPIKAWYPEGDSLGHEFIY